MDSLIRLRKSIGFSQTAFAGLLGVSVASLRRWEKGENRPSAPALDKIDRVRREIEAGHLDALLEEAARRKTDRETVRATCTFSYNGVSHPAVLMPYVCNGPRDQLDFYRQLISMQESDSSPIDWETYRSRLSLLQSVDREPTAQYLLERPGENSRSWSANAGSHGWHRYVGRFPAQLVRAIINHFGLAGDDLLLDPFCGSGTAAVEARLLGVPAMGIEISPLSAMISRVKSCFPQDGQALLTHEIQALGVFYRSRYDGFLKGRDIERFSYGDVLARSGNLIPEFNNYEKWFTREALLGASIVVEYIAGLGGGCFAKEAVAAALSARMRSIGNVDVDVVRAEYRRTPREHVDVCRLVTDQLAKMARSVGRMTESHRATILPPHKIEIIEGDCLTAELAPGSVSAIITSPPYGIESLSYLRTHLLSFRVLEPILGVDPYHFGGNVIGSEYSPEVEAVPPRFEVMEISGACRSFFSGLLQDPGLEQLRSRCLMMAAFFEDMHRLIRKFSYWLKDGGKVAFIIGNKRLGTHMIPTDQIITELFAACGFSPAGKIAHKLKTNNSNSVVPWQDRIIDNEYVLFFEKGKRL